MPKRRHRSAPAGETRVSRRRRGVLKAAAAAVPGAPAVAQSRCDVRLVTPWPAGFPGLGTAADRLAKRISLMSGGSLAVKVFAADELVPAFGEFDAVANGDAEMYHAVEYYWQGRSPAYAFFAAVPFGLTADEMAAWIYEADGQSLWDEVAGGFGLKPFLAGSTGAQMGGWFRRPVRSIDDLRGLRIAIPGLGAAVLRRLGAAPTALSGSAIVPAFRDGSIDAAEWFGPWGDVTLGLPEVASHYYYPGFHEPGTALALAVNAAFWESLTLSQKAVLEAATATETVLSRAEFDAQNAIALKALREERKVEVAPLPDRILQALGQASGEVVAEAGSHGALPQRVYQSFLQFRQTALAWSKVGDQAYREARLLPFRYGR